MRRPILRVGAHVWDPPLSARCPLKRNSNKHNVVKVTSYAGSLRCQVFHKFIRNKFPATSEFKSSHPYLEVAKTSKPKSKVMDMLTLDWCWGSVILPLSIFNKDVFSYFFHQYIICCALSCPSLPIFSCLLRSYFCISYNFIMLQIKNHLLKKNCILFLNNGRDLY